MAQPQDLHKHPSQWGYEEAALAISEGIHEVFGHRELDYVTEALANGILAPALVIPSAGWEAYKSARALAERGDHWQGGRFMPNVGDPAIAQQKRAELEADQAPVDAVNEAIDNSVNGLCGTEAALIFPRRVPIEVPEYEPETNDDGTPNEAARTANETKRRAYEQAMRASKRRADLMYAAISTRWNEIQLWEKIRKAQRRARSYGYGTLIAWLADEALVTQGGGQDGQESRPVRGIPVGTLTFEDALARISVDTFMPDQAHVYTQPTTQRQIGVQLINRVPPGGTAPRKAAFIWYIEGYGSEARMVSRLVYEPGDSTLQPRTFPEVPSYGRLPIAEMRARYLMTPSIRAQQVQLDFIGIASSAAIRTAGFRGRYLMNAKPFGRWSTTAPTASPPLDETEWNGVKWYLVEDKMYVGPGQTVALTGETMSDTVEDGEKQTVTTKRTMMTPAVQLEEPVDFDTFIAAADFRRLSILREAKQGHLALNKNAESSGVAYVQARGAFKQDLTNAAGSLERAGADFLTYIIALADLMTAPGDPLKGFLEEYRVDLEAHIDPGPLTPDEQRIEIEKWEKGAQSFETMMTNLGVQDVGAEMEKLQRDPWNQVRFLKLIGEVYNQIATTPGSSVEAALRALREAGVPSGIIEALRPQEGDTEITSLTNPPDPAAVDANGDPKPPSEKPGDKPPTGRRANGEPV